MSRDVPIRFWRGANSPHQYWEFFDPAANLPAPLAGSAFKLVVAWPDSPLGGFGVTTLAGSFTHTSDAAIGDGLLLVDPTLGRVTWPYTVAETLRMPQRGASYDLFRLIGGAVEHWCGGPVEVHSHLPAGVLTS